MAQHISRTTLLATVTLGVAMTVAGGSAAVAGSPLFGSFGGNAYGTFANATAGDIATKLGRSAYLPCPCKGTDNQVISNRVDTVNAGKPFKADAIETTVQAGKSSTQPTARNRETAKVTGVRALDGAISADAVLAEGTVWANPTTLKASAKGSLFLHLRILGQPIASNVAPNTRINLPGFGFVRLFEVKRSGDGVTTRGIKVTMLHIVIKRANSLHIPVGAEIKVSHTETRYSRTEPVAEVFGGAWASSATSSIAGVENRVGRAAAMYMGCHGTGGKVKSNNVNITNVPGIVHLATARTTVYGLVTATTGTARTTAKVEGLNLLAGFLRADAVKAVARSSFNAPTNTGSNSTAGSYFLNLRIGGIAVGDSVAPNTTVPIPGVGYVILYETSSTNDSSGVSQQVNMIHLVVNTANSLGLPVGTNLLVAAARTRAIDFH